MRTHLIPVLNDNYIFLIETTNSYICVDPAVSQPVIDFCSDKAISNILITHHHHDHTGGVKALKLHFNCEVYAPEYDRHRINDVDHWVKDQQEFSIEGLHFKVIYTPGHTLGHIVYYSKSLRSLYCGDTLFRMGCGRLFEGTAEQMLESLEKIKQLPTETKIFCAHEYTETNLKFCKHYELKSTSFEKEADKILNLRQKNLPTIPTTLGTELITNPFLMPSKFIKNMSPIESFKKIRELRNNW